MGIKENIRKTQSEIPKGVSLLAVSKTKPLSFIEEAYQVGIRDFGENKVQELVEKHDNFHKDVRWHLIGHLQTNKVKYLLNRVYLIHSLDSVRLLEQIEKVFGNADQVANALIQINIGREECKSGILDENLEGFLEKVQLCDHVFIKGIMVIIPKGDEESNKKYFRKTKQIFDELKSRNFKNISMEILSMGMTNDYITAIEEGSTLVRVGTGIFGKRDYNIGGSKNE